MRSQLAAIAAWLLMGSMPITTAAQTTSFHVSRSGSDANSGTAAAPFATLAKVRDAIRMARKADRFGDGPVVVNIGAGVYRITQTLTLTKEDSGTEKAPVVWQAANGEEVRFVGGTRLTGWTRVTDESVLTRLASAARGIVVQADLKALGVKDFGLTNGRRRAELFFDQRYLTLARYPNEGQWLRTADVPEDAKRKRPISDPKRPDLHRHAGPFIYEGDRPERWQQAKDVWMHGYWYHDWRDEYQQVAKFELQKKEVWPKPPYHSYGYKKGQRFYFLNILEELDQPGEWYLDRDSGTLYVWPPSPAGNAEITFPELEQPMLVLENARHVHIQGITFECSRSSGIVVRGGSHNEIAGCVVRNVGGTAINVTGGTHHTVRSCDVHEVASTAISIDGGDRKTLARGDHLVTNCHIHDFAKVFKTYRPGVALRGVGNRVAHSYIHDCPHEGIGYAGNDHVIEYCEFTRIARETGDVGCMYAAMDWTYLGHVFRHNYFHHIHGPGKLGCFTIYPDLPCGGIHLYGNVFYDVDQGFLTNSGRGMVIENNLFLRCKRTLRFNVWMDMKKFQLGGNWSMVERLAKVSYDQPPYSTRYPVLARLVEDFARGKEQVLQRALPKDNVVRRNVSSGGHFLTMGGYASFDHVQVERNLICDPVVFTGSPTGDGKSRTYRNEDETIRAILGRTGNVIMTGDPGLGDMRSQDFTLAADSPAWQLGFERIPFEKIGLTTDELRRTLPLEVHAPVISLPNQMFVGELTVHITPTPLPRQPKCVMRYTLDGSEPTARSRPYAGPFKVSETATVKAAAFVTRGQQTKRSDTVDASYVKLSLSEGGVYLSSLQEQELIGYPSCCKKDQNYEGGRIKLSGYEFQKGLLLHPEETEEGNLGRATYLLEGDLRRATRFTAIIGIDDLMCRYNKGSATFVVDALRNGKWERLLESGVLKLGDKPQQVTVDITDSDQLRLTTTDAGDGIACDHAVWANAKIE